MDAQATFNVVEATIADIHAAYLDGRLTARRLVETYFERIAAYDKAGPAINAVISTNPKALEEADALDAALTQGGLVGPLHGIPLIMKDQADVKDMLTTMGSVMFKDHYPDRDCFAAGKLKAAGAIFIGKSTLGELGAGDTHGSLFGSTRNVYDLERTAGGSSGGSGAAVSANFCAVAIGQEGFASIRRPSIWNGVAGMRPTAGLVSRGGVYAGWPTIIGSLGPMARTVEDLARVLECMVGFDPQDPVTALGHGKAGQGFSGLLDKDALKGARIGVLREPMGFHTDTSDPDFDRVTEVFDAAVADLAAAGAVIVDPIVIADLKALLATRARVDADDEASFDLYVSGSAASPFANRRQALASPLFEETMRGVKQRWLHTNTLEQHHAYLRAREILMMNLHAVMAEHGLDAIVHKAVEHTPTLIRDGVNPPYVDQRGAPHLNTFLTFVPSVVVPAGFTSTGLPAGITFLGRPYEDAAMLRLAYAYEQATKKRVPPNATP